MIRQREDRLFDRFRRTGDLKALATLCDRAAPELMRIAGYLIGDADLAEDLTQETFLVAMRDAENWDRSQRLLPWLLGILANQARKMRRQRRRALEPDRLVQPVPSEPVESASAAEFDAALHGALQAIASPYGEVLREHLLEGRSPSEIAAATGERPGTVRMRIHRGMEELRRLLPAGFAAGTVVTVTPSAKAMAALKQRLLAQVSATNTLATGTGTAVVAGGVLAKKLTMSVAGLLAVGLVGWSLWPPFSEEAKSPSDSGSALMRASDSTGIAVRAEASRSDSTRVSLPDANQPTTKKGVLALRVVVAGTQEPVPGLQVSFTGRGSGSGVTDTDGRVSYRGLLGSWRVDFEALEVQVDQCFRIESDHNDEILVELPIVTRIEARVVDPAGRPVSGASILLRSEHSYMYWSVAGTTDAGGVWRGTSVRPFMHLRAVKVGSLPSKAIYVKGGGGRDLHQRLELGGKAVRLSGFVLDTIGRVVPFARVGIQGFPTGALPPDQWVTDDTPWIVKCDADGRFQCASAPQGRCELLASAEVDGVKRYGRLVLTGNEDREQIVVRMVRGAVLTGWLPTSPGARLLRIHSVNKEPGLSKLSYNHLFRRGEVASDGSYRIEGIMPGNVMVVADRGSVVDWDGKPLADWHVRLRRKNQYDAQKTSDAEGRCRFVCEAGSTCEVMLKAPGIMLGGLTKSGLRMGQEEIEIRVPRHLTSASTARVRVRVVPQAGVELRELTCEVTEKGSGRHEEWFDDTDGQVDLYRTIPGTYTVKVRRGERQYLASTQPRTVAAGETLDFGDLAVSLPSSARFDLGGVAANLRAGLFVAVDMGGFLHNLTRELIVDETGMRLPSIPLRDHDFLVWGPRTAITRHHVSPVSGREQRVAIRVRRTASLKLCLPKKFAGEVTLRRLGGGLSIKERIHPDMSTYTRGLAAGTYEVECKGNDGRQFTQAVKISSRGVVSLEVTLE